MKRVVTFAIFTIAISVLVAYFIREYKKEPKYIKVRCKVTSRYAKFEKCKPIEDPECEFHNKCRPIICPDVVEEPWPCYHITFEVLYYIKDMYHQGHVHLYQKQVNLTGYPKELEYTTCYFSDRDYDDVRFTPKGFVETVLGNYKLWGSLASSAVVYILFLFVFVKKSKKNKVE